MARGAVAEAYHASSISIIILVRYGDIGEFFFWKSFWGKGLWYTLLWTVDALGTDALGTDL